MSTASMKSAWRWMGVFILALVCAVTARTQAISGSIRGTVTDGTGAVVTGAKITVTSAETGLQRSVTSNAEGAYVLLELPVGHYRLETEAAGFKKYLQDGISLDVNQQATVAIRLAVGTATQQIEVTSNAQMIETTSTNLGQTVGEREILDLPLNGRNFTQLGLLQTGVVPLTPGLLEAGGLARAGQAYAVNGQRPESNNFLIDGADNFDTVDGGLVLEPPIDAIAEFRILTHTANAEFGHSTGSTTNIITRSGTNEYHGTAWEFFRNNDMDAKSFFADSVEPLHRNQFGGVFGGPIKKDKTFFFLYYEGVRDSQGETTRTTVPSDAERTGNFADQCTLSNGTFNSQGLCMDNVTGQISQTGQLFNFFVPPNAPPQPLPFNQLPSISPLSQTLLQYYPVANQGAFTYVGTQMYSSNSDQFGVRVDHYLTSRDTLNFRYSFGQSADTDPLPQGGANVPGFPVATNQREQNFVAQETHTFSSTLVGTLRASYLRNKFLLGNSQNHTDPASLGFEYTPSLEAAIGPPFIQVGGYASIGNPITGPRNTYQNTWDFSGGLTWIKGRHQFKFGGGYQYDQINFLNGIATNGFFVFSTFPLGNLQGAGPAFADFLFGQPVVFLQGGGDFNRWLRWQAFNLYAQDTWRVTSRLTVNYGLRYEVPSPATEIHNYQNLWIPGRKSVVFPTAPEGLLYPGDPGVPRGLIPTDRAGWAPRVGLAWDVKGDGKWLVTAAYGIFYDPYYTGEGGPLQDPLSAPPYLQTPQVSLPNFADPFNGQNPFNQIFSPDMTLLVLNPNLRLPYAQDYNVNVERALGRDWLLEVGYIGTKGTKLPRFIEGNPAVYIPGESTQNNADQRRLYSGCTVAEVNPTCTYSSVGEIAGIADSSYNALQVSLKRRFAQGFSMLASYTYSKTLDDVSSFNITGSASQSVAGENDLAQNPFDVKAEWGRSMFDARHRLVISYQWDLPWYQHSDRWYAHILGGWQVNGITTLMSNTPFTVYDSSNPSLQGSAPEISGFYSSRPNIVGNPNTGTCAGGVAVRTAQCWFNTGAFQHAAIGTFGDVGRNTMNGPAFQQWDFSAVKTIPIHENMNLQFRGEIFNIFNNVNFLLPNNDINSPGFGQITAAQAGRIVQLALKFSF
ncbi:MAG TPA: carboxypeptidase regulatory-like domain-containing protein [Candidatus Eremiobacteraceae bacterium]|nr:carboxypeptidase regulatory-like domain-containing protein [Candidatus Eremiobacteraceae bacterium]